MLNWIPLLLLTGSLLFSGQPLDYYFKKVENKNCFSTVRNIDFIYMINLDQRPEKFAHCVDALAPYGITPCRFSAVNGWELSLDVINDVGVTFQKGMKGHFMGTSYDANGCFHSEIGHYGQVYFCHCMTRGNIGIVLSHLSVLQDAWDSGYETVWVMEDDIEIIQNPHLLSDRIEQLDHLVGVKGWDILFTDRDTKDQNGSYVSCRGYAKRPNFQPADPSIFRKHRVMPGGVFRQVGARYGAYSMIVRRSGIEKILKFFKKNKIFLPYDMDFCLPPHIKCFALSSDIISTQKNALSDNGLPYYLNKDTPVA